MLKRSLRTGLLSASLAFAVASPVRADTSSEDRAAADSLYDDGGRLMTAGRWEEACPKLEASEKLDPGIGTLIRLGYCYTFGKPEEGRGKTASAWAAFNEAQGMASKAHDKRADEAARLAKVLEPKLSRLLLDVAPENRAAGLVVRRDGKEVDAGLWGSALPVDPGAHVVEAVKPGKLPWTTTFQIEAKPGVVTVRVPALVDGPLAPTVPDKIAPPFWRAQRITGAVLGGAGAVVLAVGVGFGVTTLGRNSDSLAQCLPHDPTRCYAPGVALRNDAYSSATVSTISFVAGGVLAASGLVTFFTAPSSAAKGSATAKHRRALPVVGVGAGVLTLQGEW